MDPKKILQSYYLDIIFDKRNKNYGGYELRKNYNRRIKKAGLFGVLCLASLFSFSFISAHRNAPRDIISTHVITMTNPLLPPPPPNTPPPPPKPPSTPPSAP